MITKQTALWLMIIGAGLSLYDISTTPTNGTGGELYGPDKPLASMRWNVYTREAVAAAGSAPAVPAKNYYLSISDAAALVGAYYYFR